MFISLYNKKSALGKCCCNSRNAIEATLADPTGLKMVRCKEKGCIS